MAYFNIWLVAVATLTEVIGDILSLLGRFQADEFHGDGAAVLVSQEEVESRRVRVLP